MRLTRCIWILFISFGLAPLGLKSQEISFDFYGSPITIPWTTQNEISCQKNISPQDVTQFSQAILTGGFNQVISALLTYKQSLQLDDWPYYQLIRKTSQAISPKGAHYGRYTLYKWALMKASGYDVSIRLGGGKILFYIQSDEKVYNIPAYIKNNRQYVCLNYHDYTDIDFDQTRFEEVQTFMVQDFRSFSYKISQLPELNSESYVDRELSFAYYNDQQQFRVKINPDINNLFINYPVLDYELYFNIPMSRETYSSFIPLLKKHLKKKSTREGVDYLMRFTRYAFMFGADEKNFGKEKRLSPEQTLLFDQSDCDDRAALFFYLVKEIYNLPMIVITYPRHVTIGIKFDKPIGKTIEYNGLHYSICEPTPQKLDLRIGQIMPKFHKQQYEIAYAYNPN